MAIIIEVKVIPSSGKSACIMNKGGVIVCYVKSAAQHGDANRELITFFARALRMRQQEIKIISGLTSRKKRLSFQTDMSKEQLFMALGFDKQMSLL